MQEKARIFQSSWWYSRFLIQFSIRKKWLFLYLRTPVLLSKQVVLIRSTPTYLRCIADKTRSKYDQPTLYRRPPRSTPAQQTTCGERDHPRPFFNRLKNLSRSPRPLRGGPTNPRRILNQHTLSAIKVRSLPICPFFQSGRERGLIGSLVWTGLYIRESIIPQFQITWCKSSRRLRPTEATALRKINSLQLHVKDIR